MFPFLEVFKSFTIGCQMALATHLQGDGEASPSVGLDVGTTNSAVAVRRADGRFVVIPPPGPNGSNCRPTLLQNHDKKHEDLTWHGHVY